MVIYPNTYRSTVSPTTVVVTITPTTEIVTVTPTTVIVTTTDATETVTVTPTTETITVTPITETNTVSTTVTVTVTAVPVCNRKRDDVFAEGDIVEGSSNITFVPREPKAAQDKRTVDLGHLRQFAAEKVSEACSCLSLVPQTITLTATPAQQVRTSARDPDPTFSFCIYCQIPDQ